MRFGVGWPCLLLAVNLSDLERFAWLAATSGLALIVLLSSLTTLNDFQTADKIVLVFCLLATAPLLAYLPTSPITKEFYHAVERPILSLNVAFASLGLAWLLAFNLQLVRTPFSSWVISLCYSLAAAAVIFARRRNGARARNFGWHVVVPIAVAAMMVVLPVMTIVATVVPGNWYMVRPFDARAAWAAGLVAVVTLFLWRQKRFEETSGLRQRAFASFVTIATLLFPLLMMDVELSYDALHYTAYLAPALAVQSGGIPLVDVFCQYGLCYLIYNLFFLVLPNTFHSAALVTTVVNAATTILGLTILRRLIKSHVVFAIVGVSLPFLLTLIYHYASNMTPSHGGMRYFPVFAVAASLVYMEPSKQFNLSSIAALLLAWVWSFEAQVYGTVIYLAFLGSVAAVQSDRFGRVLYQFVKSIGRLAVLLLGGMGVVVAGFLAVYHQLPRYDLYLSMVSAYVGPDPFMDYSFYQSGFYAWAPLLLCYFLSVCIIFRSIFVCRREQGILVAILAVVTALGMTTGVYCLISTQSYTLKVGLLPFFILVVWGVDAVVHRSVPASFDISEISLSLVFVSFSVLLAGVAFGNFVPVASYASPNTSALRHLIGEGRLSPTNFVDRLRDSCALTDAGEVNTACAPGPHAPKVHYAEFKKLLEQWFMNERRLLTFQPGDAIVRVLIQKPHALPSSFFYVDGFSPELFAYIVVRSRRVIDEELREGQPVMISKDQFALNELQWALLTALTGRWRLAKVDESEHFAIYRLREKQPDAEIPMLIDRPVKTRNAL